MDHGCHVDAIWVLRMYEDLRVAQVLHWSISRIVQEIVEVAEGVCKFSRDKDALQPPSPESGGMLSIFENLAEKDHLLYALRGILSYFLCFLIGYFGWGELIPPKSPAIAATAPLLLSMYSGSALVNDLNLIRPQCLEVFARLLGGFLDSCEWPDLVLHSMTLVTFLWTFGGLFVYFHSRNFSTVGVLAAAFGASTLLAVSCNHPHKIGTLAAKQTCPARGCMNRENCVAFTITMLMDSMFHSNRILAFTIRASDLAFKKLNACWDESLGLLALRKDDQSQGCSKTARNLVAMAKPSKALEPRFWRIRWHHDLFTNVPWQFRGRITLATLESAIAENGRSGDSKFPTFVKLSDSGHVEVAISMFGDAKSVILLLKFTGIQKLLKVFVHETVQQPLWFDGFTDEDSTHQFFAEQQAVEQDMGTPHICQLQEFIQETVPRFFGLEDDQAELCMSHDEMAHLSVVFAGFNRTTALLRCSEGQPGSVQHNILASHWES
eukprot:Skav224133  [mRNA]  locus=scaffold462:54062:63863:- [translate_table: standard]